MLKELSSAQRLQLAFNQVSDSALVLMDLDGSILEWGAGAEALFGWTAYEAAGQSIALIFLADDQAEGLPRQELEAAASIGKSADLRWLRHKDGTQLFIEGELSALRGPAGEIVGYAKTMRQVCPPVQNDAAASAIDQAADDTQHHTFLSLVLENIEDGIVACDANGRLTFFNRATRAFHGMSESRIPPEQWSAHYNLFRPDGITPLPLADIPLFRALSGENVRDAEMVIAPNNGHRCTVLASGGPLLDSNGHKIGAVVSMHDITALRETERVNHELLREQARHEAAEVASELIQMNEQRFRLLATTVSQIVWIANARGELVESPSWTPFTGQPPEEWKGDGWLKMVHPDDREALVAHWNEALDSGSLFETEHRIMHHDGRYRWVTGRAAPVIDGSGAIREWVGIDFDITHQKRAEQDLLDARLRLEAALMAADIGTWNFDLIANQVYADANMLQLYGLTQEHPQDRDQDGVALERFFNAVHPEDVERVRERLETAVANGKSYQDSYRICLPGGRIRYVHVRGKVSFANDGTPLWLPGVALDVTPLKEVEEGLRRREERYRALFNSIDEGFYIIELIFDDAGKAVDYRFLEANPAAERLNGLTDVVGKTLRELVPAPKMSWIETYAKAILTGQAVRFTDHSDNLKRWYEISVTRLGDGSDHQAALLFDDITERKRNEEELRRLAADLSQSNQRQREFLATLAHELRNPLAPIRAGLDLMEASPNPATITRVREIMRRQVDHLVHLVNDLLDIARITSGKIELKLEPVALKDIVFSAIETTLPAMEAKHHDFQFSVPDEPIPLVADANRLAQVIGNLLTNAAKYTPENGRITLDVRREGTEAVITVSDNGIGIPANELSAVFDMFSQASHSKAHAQGGLGIGLSLVKRLTEKHGGRVSATSAGPRQGSTFTVRLPIAAQLDGGSADRVSAAPSATGSGQALRILVVDDNRDAATLLAQMLALSGHEVDVAHDGEAGLKAAARFTPHIAMLDLGMPGMNGYELARALRGMPQLDGTVLLALTGWGAEEERQRTRAAGFEYHLTKPVEFETLRKLIASIGANANSD
jgi:PAS domain S-box-containing protein